MPDQRQPIEGAGTDPNAFPRRSGGSSNDPHGGVERDERKFPDPDPIDELATIDGTGRGGPGDRPSLAAQSGPQPGFGPEEFTPAAVEGDADRGIDPREAAAVTGNGR